MRYVKFIKDQIFECIFIVMPQVTVTDLIQEMEAETVDEMNITEVNTKIHYYFFYFQMCLQKRKHCMH
jgi:hypothetical protein